MITTYQWAHDKCHPETCSCEADWRVVQDGKTIAWAEDEARARFLAEKVYNDKDWRDLK